MTPTTFFQLIVGGLSIGSIYGLVALSYNVIFNTTNVINFSQGELVTVGALLGFTFYVVFKLPLFLALVFAALVVSFLALVVERISVRPVKDISQNFIWIMSTFGFGVALKHTAMLIWGKSPLPFPKFIGGNEPIPVFGVLILPQEIGIFLIAVICTVALELYRKKTIFGTAVRATALDRETASIMGINTNYVIYFSFAIGGILAAICGILVSPITFADPTMGIVLGVKGFVVMIVGGLGSATGAILGGLFLGLVETFSATLISSLWKDVIAFLILIFVMLVKPSGFFGKRRVTS
ncbi:MAG: branched-chain amino acid ABC transporter permease [candidate division Zixibacteria bacterium]|nr:branched-chain amino acid ABC transporter permease [candidate division Zixibacteria bacterium]